MKLGIVIDSSAGITKKEAINKGWYYLPLHLSVNGKEYVDGVDITPDEYFQMIDISMETKTSTTSPSVILSTIDQIQTKYDLIIVYGLSSQLSSQTNNLKTFLKDYSNVHVVNSCGVGYAIVEELEIIEKLAQEAKTKEELINQIEFLTKQQMGVIVLSTMDWLAKGGRTSHSLAVMSNSLKVIPIILFKDGALHKFANGMIFEKAMVKASLMLQKKVKNKIGKFIFYVANTKNQELIVAKIQNKLGIKKIEIRKFPPIIVNHIGPNSICLLYVSTQII